MGLKVTSFASGDEFLAAGNITTYDFFIIDLGLPGIDGVDLIMIVRRQSNAGVIIISGRMGPDAFNAGLSAGANMFINKPVRFDQVVQAIKTVSASNFNSETGVVSWELVPDESKLTCSKGPSVHLTPLELLILKALITNGEAGGNRKMICAQLGMDDKSSARNLDAAIFRLRKKIENTTKRVSPIRTLHGVGYVLTAQIR